MIYSSYFDRYTYGLGVGEGVAVWRLWVMAWEWE